MSVLTVLACRVHFLDRHQSRFAVEIGIGEKARGTAGVIEDVEKELAVIVLDAGAAADDLLEFGHGIDGAGDHDVLAGLNVYASGQQLRSSDNRWSGGLKFHEAVEMAAPGFAFVRRDARQHNPGIAAPNPR